MKKAQIICAAVLCLTLTLTGCGNTAVEMPDLEGLGETVIIAREEGSGTRSEFETLADTTESGANQTVFSTESVIDAVAADVNAIGYIAYSSLEDAKGVKALAIDGIAPTSDTISDGDYSLCREYILAYTGELRDVEADFIRYIRSEGQAIVAKTCTPVKSVSTFLSDKSEGTILINGSSSVAPIMEELAAAYCELNPNAVIEIEVSDSGEGINAALRGDCDLAMSSRSLKDYEAELLETKTIAADGIAVIVNEENPITELTLDQIKSIYDGEITQWTDLAG